MVEKITNVVVDLGNYNVKFKGENMGCFSSKINTKFEANHDAYESINYNNTITYIGVGTFDREFNKCSKNIIPQVLYAISKATLEEEVNLCLLLPILQLSNRSSLINKLENRSFNFYLNNIEKNIKINKVIVLPECQVARYSITEYSPFSLIIDIGGRTVNWSAYENDKLQKNGTEKIGVMDLYTTIKDIENAKGEDYIEEEIEGQILRGRIRVNDDVYKDFLFDILNRIKTRINIKNYDVIFVGGGVIVLKDILSKIPNIELHNDPLYANVIGAYSILERNMR